MVIGPLTRQQVGWLMNAGVRAFTGIAHDNRTNPPYSVYCVGQSEQEVRAWIEAEAWRLYDKREGIIRP